MYRDFTAEGPNGPDPNPTQNSQDRMHAAQPTIFEPIMEAPNIDQEEEKIGQEEMINTVTNVDGVLTMSQTRQNEPTNPWLETQRLLALKQIEVPRIPGHEKMMQAPPTEEEAYYRPVPTLEQPELKGVWKSLEMTRELNRAKKSAIISKRRETAMTPSKLA